MADDDGAGICGRCAFNDLEVVEGAVEDNAAKGSTTGWDDFVIWSVWNRDAG